MTIYMEMSNKGVIIADTSGLVSLFNPADRNHTEAINAAKQLTNDKKTILIPAAVFVEFLNVLGRKASHEAALAAAAELTPPFLVLSEPTNLLQSPALKKFANIAEAVSFTDCLVMAVADEYGTPEIFGFDKQFQDAGYKRLQPSTEWKHDG
jgi:predicted nucleic acid-binding protein